MTLQEALHFIAAHPQLVLIYFFLIPAIALIAGDLDRKKGPKSKWNSLYSFLIYLVCIPGVFAITLFFYQLFFAGRNLMETDIITELVPIASMILTLFIIRRNVDLTYVPGFDRLSGLLIVIFVLMIAFWLLDKTRIVAWTYFPFHYLILLFVGLILLITYGMRKLGRG